MPYQGSVLYMIKTKKATILFENILKWAIVIIAILVVLGIIRLVVSGISGTWRMLI